MVFSGMLKGLLRFRTVSFVAVLAGASGVLVGHAGPALASQRAYEMVSPLDKNGGDIMGRSTRTRASADGSALQFASHTAFGDARGTGIGVEYVARREGREGTQGWDTHAITPKSEPISPVELLLGQLDPRYLGEFSSDLSKAIFLTTSPLASPTPKTGSNVALYRRVDLLAPGDGNYQLVTDCPACVDPLPPFGTRQPGFAGASADFGHVIFESNWNLTQDAVDAGLDEERPKLYEWDHGTVRLAGVLPNGAPAPSSAAGQGAGSRPVPKGYTPNTISTDGSRITFTAPVDANSGDSEGVADLYLREDHATTVQVNAEERTISPDPPPDSPARFGAASADLSKIFFMTGEQLTDDDANPNSSDLYLYDASLPASNSHNLTRLVTDSEPDDGTDSEVPEVLGAGEDGDYVYFYSTNQLVDDGVSGDTVVPCQPDWCIFVWHEGSIDFVGRTPNVEVNTLVGGNWIVFATKASRITPDGTRLLFLSDGVPGESYDHGVACSTESDGDQEYFNTNPGCAELYLYNATANGGHGQLKCVSCNPGGTHLTNTEARIDIKTATISLPTSHLNRAVSDDGRYVFFSTGERLVPADNNGDVYDVYQYDTSTDQVDLISSGKSPFNSFFLDASSNGHDVFFRTREQLTGWDTDQQIDVYDASIGGGFPDPVAAAPECSGGSCQGSQGGDVTVSEPGTATFESKRAGGKGGRAAVFHTFDLGPRKLGRWAKTGVVTLLVRASEEGRISAQVRARIGGDRRLVAADVVRIRNGGTARLRLQLSKAARSRLRATGRLRLTIRVAYSGADSIQQAHAVLKAP